MLVNVTCVVNVTAYWAPKFDRDDPTEKFLDGLVQDCSNSVALAMELLQSYTKPSK